MGVGVGLGFGVAVGTGVGVGLELGDGEGVGVEVGLGVAVGVGLGVGEAVGVGVLVGVGVGVGEGLGVGDAVGFTVANGSICRWLPEIVEYTLCFPLFCAKNVNCVSAAATTKRAKRIINAKYADLRTRFFLTILSISKTPDLVRIEKWIAGSLLFD